MNEVKMINEFNKENQLTLKNRSKFDNKFNLNVSMYDFNLIDLEHNNNKNNLIDLQKKLYNKFNNKKRKLYNLFNIFNNNINIEQNLFEKAYDFQYKVKLLKNDSSCKDLYKNSKKIYKYNKILSFNIKEMKNFIKRLDKLHV